VSKTKIVIVGTGGFGREVHMSLNFIQKKFENFEILGYLDDNRSLNGKLINNLKVLGGLEWFNDNNLDNIKCTITIGNPAIRKKIVEKLKSNLIHQTIIHPSIICSETSTIGIGTILQPGSIITVNTKIGNYVHVNLHSTIGHDCVVEDYVTINPGVHINGNTTIGEGTFVGSGASLKEGISIGKWCIIGAGSVVLNDVPDYTMYAGVPAKFKKKLES
jgi:sugar O-acyltransferase (sialic acid O-acetyltransferase NeuD family)